MQAFVTVIGEDKVGIIHKVTSVLAENNINILDINQTLLEDYFTMVMLIGLSKSKVEFIELKNILEKKGEEIEVTIKIQRKELFNSIYNI